MKIIAYIIILIILYNPAYSIVVFNNDDVEIGVGADLDLAFSYDDISFMPIEELYLYKSSVLLNFTHKVTSHSSISANFDLWVDETGISTRQWYIMLAAQWRSQPVIELKIGQVEDFMSNYMTDKIDIINTDEDILKHKDIFGRQISFLGVDYLYYFSKFIKIHYNYMLEQDVVESNNMIPVLNNHLQLESDNIYHIKKGYSIMPTFFINDIYSLSLGYSKIRLDIEPVTASLNSLSSPLGDNVKLKPTVQRNTIRRYIVTSSVKVSGFEGMINYFNVKNTLYNLYNRYEEYDYYLGYNLFKSPFTIYYWKSTYIDHIAHTNAKEVSDTRVYGIKLQANNYSKVSAEFVDTGSHHTFYTRIHLTI